MNSFFTKNSKGNPSQVVCFRCVCLCIALANCLTRRIQCCRRSLFVFKLIIIDYQIKQPAAKLPKGPVILSDLQIEFEFSWNLFG